MKILFIGAINKYNPPRGGEEYKNQLLDLKINESYNFPIMIDTNRWSNKPQIWWDLLVSILFKKVDVVLISASSVSTYRLLNIIRWMKPSLLHKTTYLVIGGYFPEGIRTKRFNWKAYSKLKNVVVEGELLRQQIISNSNLVNVKVVPNFKTFPNLDIKDRIIKNGKFRFVFVGRISNAKGINEILEAAQILKSSNEEFEIDFYGPTEERFDFNNKNTKYSGFLDFQNNSEKSYLTLTENNCMLFPTYWMGEGFPGVIIDAFVAGLPVIATDWNMNTEIIEDGVNGFIIEPKSSKALAEKMEYAMQNREELEKISENNLARAKDYHIDKIWPQIMELL
jgi:glycosyltransferase involved in cell wall biosynthesis